MSQAPAQRRRAMVHRLFPQGIPQLWCPPLTHYADDGRIDAARIEAHLATLASYVGGLLVPGSTGDGWELTEAEARQVLDLALELAPRLGVHVLVGALDPDAAAARQRIIDTALWLKERSGCEEALDALAASHVCGFAFCPPKGADLPQDAIREALAAILDLGLPSALYQLPQVTQNEMAPETVADLAARFGNLYLCKDSSGGDRVATSGLDLGGLFLVRGAETDYARWHAGSGGLYNGFLLSTANCFAPQLHRMIKHLNAGRVAKGEALSDLVSRAIAGVFELVDPLPVGNRYTNANKAIDHFMARGPEAAKLPPPRLHAGRRLPQEVIDRTGEVLGELGLMPTVGYVDS